MANKPEIEAAKGTFPSPFLKAAAVLASFDPEEIRPVGKPSPAELEASFQELIATSTVTYDSNVNAIWSLRGDVRRQVLQSLKDRRAMVACLKANPRRPKVTLQKMLERYLKGEAPPISEQTSSQLSSTMQVIDWLGEILPDLPPREELQERIEWVSLIAPFRFLVDEHFRGRQDQLDALSDYVGLLGPGSVYSTIGRSLRQLFNLQAKPPLLIYGPGGVGKSTLLAKFILDHAVETKTERTAFAYLDLDRPNLLGREPLTLLAEVARQLAVQYPESRRNFIATHDDILAELTRVARASDPANKGSTLVQWRISDAARSNFLQDFSGVVSSSVGLDKTLLLVLDTFERVQFRSQDHVENLWEFLRALRACVPRLRTVIAGRAPMDKRRKLEVEEVHLTELDFESAMSYLKSREIRDPATARHVIDQVGRNPLTLKLAAEVITADSEIAADPSLIPSRVSKRLVQGILYRRVLQHIGNEDVRKLSHPGLILRRITPDLIQEVLAESCGVTGVDAERAQELFSELKREVAIVGPSEDGSLRHRPELRQLMIGLLVADAPQKVLEIQRKAIQYYGSRTDPISRAEEIYHRLAIGEDVRSVDERWITGVEEHLAGPWDDLSVQAQRYLASRTDFELLDDNWSRADVESKERRASRRAQDFLARGMPDRALSIAREQKRRTPLSPLYAIEARAQFELREFEDARQSVRSAIQSLSRNGKPIPIDLLVLDSELDRRIGLGDSPEAKVRSFRAAAFHCQDVRLLQLGLNELAALQSQTSPPESNEASRGDLTRLQIKLSSSEAWSRRLLLARQEIQEELAKYVRDAKPEDLAEYPDLSRHLVSEIGLAHRDIAEPLIRLTGMGTELVSYVVREVPAFLATWDFALSPSGSNRSAIATSVGAHLSNSSPEIWAKYLAGRDTDEVAHLVDAALVKLGLPEEIFGQVISLLQQAFQRRQRYGKPV
jgi:hypothetical protein